MNTPAPWGSFELKQREWNGKSSSNKGFMDLQLLARLSQYDTRTKADLIF